MAHEPMMCARRRSPCQDLENTRLSSEERVQMNQLTMTCIYRFNAATSQLQVQVSLHYNGRLRIGGLRSVPPPPAPFTASSLLLFNRNYFLPLVGAAACPGFGRFAPYFERPRRRFETPSLSSVPRTMW